MTNSETTLRAFDFAGLELRVIMHMAEPWFVGSDVCKALGFYVRADGTAEVSTATRHLSGDERGTYPVRTDTGMRRLICLSESGLYKLIMRSDKPEAVKFQDWVTGDVLPAIRKTGGYLLNEEARDTAKADDREAMPLPELFAQLLILNRPVRPTADS